MSPKIQTIFKQFLCFLSLWLSSYSFRLINPILLCILLLLYHISIYSYIPVLKLSKFSNFSHYVHILFSMLHGMILYRHYHKDSLFYCIPFTSLVHNQIPFLNYILTNRKLVFNLFVQGFGYTPFSSHKSFIFQKFLLFLQKFLQ